MPPKRSEPNPVKIDVSEMVERDEERERASSLRVSRLRLLKQEELDPSYEGWSFSLKARVDSTAGFDLDHLQVEVRRYDENDEFIRTEWVSAHKRLNNACVDLDGGWHTSHGDPQTHRVELALAMPDLNDDDVGVTEVPMDVVCDSADLGVWQSEAWTVGSAPGVTHVKVALRANTVDAVELEAIERQADPSVWSWVDKPLVGDHRLQIFWFGEDADLIASWSDLVAAGYPVPRVLTSWAIPPGNQEVARVAVHLSRS